MIKKYLSVIYDLTQFGIFNISNAMVACDMDEGITIDVSFDGGSSFIKVNKLNTKFSVKNSKGKIQMRITFENSNNRGIYSIRASGFFQNLEMGTTIYFSNNSVKTNFQTIIGINGAYSIQLPRGIYTIWYKDPKNKNQKTDLMTNFNPEIVLLPSNRLDKENLIEGLLKEVEWAKYSVFDTFSDPNKKLYGDTIIDVDGDLSDGLTDRKVRYIAVLFD